MDKIWEKYDELVKYLKGLESVMAAFSGGVDSMLLLKAAKTALGERAAAVTVSFEGLPQRELEESRVFCQKEEVKQYIIKLEIFGREELRNNPQNRCYICKKEIFKSIINTAEREGFKSVVEGSNADDGEDYRPGRLALKELGVLSPLSLVGLKKAEIRALARELGIEGWNKPACACLASRLVYGEEITKEKLNLAEKGEEFLKGLGIAALRVRIHGNKDFLARIEVLGEDFNVVLENKNKIQEYFKGLGFSYAALDLEGYRRGSMNETILKDLEV